MEPKIICKEEKLLVGIAREMNQSDNLKNALIENVKREFRTKAKTIDNRINSELYYAAYDYVPADISKADNEINYIYYYCAEVADYDKIPTDMVKKTLPQAKYAVFHYDTANNTLNGEKLSQSVYDYIDGIWLPDSKLWNSRIRIISDGSGRPEALLRSSGSVPLFRRKPEDVVGIPSHYRAGQLLLYASVYH